MLIDDIKSRIAGAMKAGDAVARDVLRLALGEIQTLEARKNAPASDDEAAAAVRKLIKSNEETLGLTNEGERAAVLRREIELLSELLPKRLSVEEIVAALASQHDSIKAAKNDGQATGIAMKHLKA
ncbi:MAG TPA: GatB/YqeY domain-containing protein, partial [Labilithrix sp.]|nr:GatB/YqeY domain-containing protein [Labilithrix sp.]